jgi:hypothetical protein
VPEGSGGLGGGGGLEDGGALEGGGELEGVALPGGGPAVSVVRAD